ncbi:MAG: FAD-dependent oxidoreductase [Aquabacterium sp.]|uniref:flavin monoamine oxidase family protein n=1 Tax=Aquabacterium sp. TaxID=1872578 RepID=UPI0025BD6302|nr:FAD-dependent oxidoreductase [Aquabacterium sp.]MBI5925368.1 FAD-dependent oxidoreductase [Aquabacterium sp.]
MSQPETPSRRRLLGGLTATAAAALLPAGRDNLAQAATGPGAMGDYNTDVVVIGGGYAGLACARALVAAGRQVVLLEARDRVGGRCFNINLPAPYGQYTVEGGAEFIGPTQDRMYSLVQQLGLKTFPSYNTGKQINYIGGKRSTYSGVLPWTGLYSTAEIGIAMLRLDDMAKTVPLDAPWNASKAMQWDNQSAQTWMDANVLSADAKSLLRLAVLALLSVEPRDVSMLYLLFYIHSGGGLTSLLSTAGGAQQDRIVGGSQAIALGMARELGTRILYNSPVRKVKQDAYGIAVSGDGFTVRAQHAVMAMSPWMASRLAYEPFDGPLQYRMQMMQRVPMGSIWKVHCVYDKPFWRDDGLCGQVTSDAYLPKLVFDNTPPEPGAPGVLMGFIDGQDARDAVLMTPEARKANVLKAMSIYFGAKAATPIAYTENNWQSENFSAGGPTGVFPPGVLTGFGAALRAPSGRLHWAGTETSTVWTGYMDGAVRSGERAASEILGQ